MTKVDKETRCSYAVTTKSKRKLVKHEKHESSNEKTERVRNDANEHETKYHIIW